MGNEANNNPGYEEVVSSIFKKIHERSINLNAEGNELLNLLDDIRYDNLLVAQNPWFKSVESIKFFEKNPPDPSIEAALLKDDFYILQFPVNIKSRSGYNEVQVELRSEAQKMEDLPIFFSALPDDRFIETLNGKLQADVSVSSGLQFNVKPVDLGQVKFNETKIGANSSGSIGFNFSFTLGQMQVERSGEKGNELIWTFKGPEIKNDIKNLTTIIECRKGTQFRINVRTVGRRKGQKIADLQQFCKRFWDWLTNVEREQVTNGFPFEAKTVSWTNPMS